MFGLSALLSVFFCSPGSGTGDPCGCVFLRCFGRFFCLLLSDCLLMRLLTIVLHFWVHAWWRLSPLSANLHSCSCFSGNLTGRRLGSTTHVFQFAVPWLLRLTGCLSRVGAYRGNSPASVEPWLMLHAGSNLSSGCRFADIPIFRAHVFCVPSVQGFWLGEGYPVSLSASYFDRRG